MPATTWSNGMKINTSQSSDERLSNIDECEMGPDNVPEAVRTSATKKWSSSYSKVHHMVIAMIMIASFLGMHQLWLINNDNGALWKRIGFPGAQEVVKGYRGCSNGAPYTDVDYSTYEQYLDTVTFENASAIFNTISNTLSQKGSDLLPNGMSIIPAVIPAGTYLWHGCDGEFPASPEWIAMDAEFSYSFSSRLPRIGRGRFHHHEVSESPEPSGYSSPPGDEPLEDFDALGKHSNGTKKKHGGAYGGSLLTFRAKKDLSKILVLDGASASKLDNGQSDTQFLLSRINTSEPHDDWRIEYTAAEIICNWGKDFGLDGYVRLETAFELILCDFHSPKIELISNVSFGDMNSVSGIDFPEFTDIDGNDDNDTISENPLLFDVGKQVTMMPNYEQLQLVAFHRYDEPRIVPDFSGMVTAINRSYVSPDTYTRRMSNFSEEIKEQMITDIETYFSAAGADPYSGTNWKDQTRVIIEKFGPILLILNNSYTGYDKGELPLSSVATNITVFTFNTLRRFYDWSISDSLERKALARRAFVFEYAHPTGVGLRSETDRLIWSSLAKIAATIWDELEYQYEFATRTIRKISSKESLEDAAYKGDVEAHYQSVKDLLNGLQWYPFYYQCPRACSWNEVCYAPVWGPGPRPKSQGDTFGSRKGRITADEVQCVSVFDM